MIAPAAADFARDWARLWSGEAHVGLAVSGGPDSLALMILADGSIGPDRFAVATVDHGLRPDSGAEARHVAALCAARGIDHTILPIGLASGAAIQERARDARYRALGGWCRDRGLAALVTAHHADDQAETIVMRLNRGAGLRGLAGMRPVATVPGVPGVPLPLLRPLLGWRREALGMVVAQAGVIAVTDPSNQDMRFERARIRSELARSAWLDAGGIAASAAHLAQADAALDWAAAQVPIACVNGAVLLDPDLPRALMLRVLERVVIALGGTIGRGRDLARWHDRMVAGAIATFSGVRGDGGVRPWRFTAAPPHRNRLA